MYFQQASGTRSSQILFITEKKADHLIYFGAILPHCIEMTPVCINDTYDTPI